MKTNFRRYKRFILTYFVFALVAAIASMLIPVQPVFAEGTVYYVSKSGSDSNPGTESKPWLTIQKAAETLVPGDIVYIKEGIYNEQVIPANSGTKDYPITYSTYPGSTVIIDGTGTQFLNWHGLFDINNKSNIVVQGFEIQNAESGTLYGYDAQKKYGMHGVRIWGESSNDITLNNLIIHDTAICGIVVKSGWGDPAWIENITIDGCIIYNTNSTADDEALSLSKTTDFEIKNCLVYSILGNSDHPHKEGIGIGAFGDSGSIHDNEIFLAEQGIYINSHSNAPNNIFVYNNLIHDCYDFGIALGSEMTGHPDLAGINIYNNVICNNVKGGFAAFDYNGFYRTFSLINNTFYNNGDIREIVLDGSSSAYNDCIVSNNIIVNNYKSAYLIRFRNYDGADVLINNNLFYDISGYQKDNVYGLDYILDQDPLFTDPENGDFTLQKKSPAIDAGLAVDTIATDYAGNARPEDTGIDIGAYEYVKTNSSPVNHVKIKPSTARATASLIGSEADGIMNMMSLDELTDDYTADISSHIVPVTGQTSYVAEAYDSENNLVSGLDFRWSVNNPEAGSIDANGLFTAGTETGYFEDLIQATTDDGVTGTASVTIIESPFAPIEDQLVDEGQSILFTVSANVEDGLVYSAYNLPDGAAFDEIIQLFSWTPSYEQAGYYDDIQFQATDGTYIVTGTVNITVNDINRAPILDSIGDRMVDEGTTLSFNVSGSDPDGDNLTYTSHYLPEDAVFDESAGEFTWTPSTEQTGNYFGIIFQVSDGRLTDEEEIAITVNKVNHSPVIDAVGNKIVETGDTLAFTVTGSDPDGDDLTYSASNLPDGAEFNPATRVFSWTPGQSQAGRYTNIRLGVTDGELSDLTTTTITVMGKTVDLNNAPVLDSIGDKSVGIRERLIFSISASDADGDRLTYSASNIPQRSIFSNSSGRFIFIPSSSQAGTYKITFTVTDGALTDSETITIWVTGPNKAPVMNAITPKTVEAGNTLMFKVQASDANGDVLTYSASNLPDGAEFDPSTRVFSWTPGQSQAGRYTNIRFGVTDGESSDLTTTTITVMGGSSNLDNAPVMDPIGDKSVGIGGRLTFSIAATDADGDRLTYNATDMPQRATLNKNSGGFVFTPSLSQIGTYEVTFTVTDGALTDSETITIRVTEPNKAPVMNTILPQTIEAGETLTFEVQASDANGDALTCWASGLPDGSEFDPATRIFSWSPSASQTGTSHVIRFYVTDGTATVYKIAYIRVR